MTGSRSRFKTFFIVFFFIVTAYTQEIEEAVKGGDLITVKKLLHSNPELLHYENANKEALIHLAAGRGHTEIVKLLLEKGIDINTKTKWGWTPLLYAINFRKVETSKLLLEKGANPNQNNVWRQTPLHFAAMTGMVSITKLLINKGAEINATTEEGITPLHYAAQRGRNDVVEILIKSGANINVKDVGGITPIMYACQSGHYETFETLVQKGADIETTDCIGRTLLHKASINGNFRTVEFLLNKNIKINLKDNHGHEPLYYAAKHGHKKVAELLKARGAKTENYQENYGYSVYLKRKLSNGEAFIWYLHHSGVAVKTRSKLLIFDYIDWGNKPSQPLLANGFINPDEIRDQNVYVFVTHGHGDHYDEVIFEWEKVIKNIKYVFGWHVNKGNQYYEIEGREHKIIDDLEISTYKADHGNDGGVGFLIRTDGLVIFHSGDHFNSGKELKESFITEIDYFARIANSIDFAFINGPNELKREGVYYIIEKLRPKFTLPVHGGGREFLYNKLAKAAEKKKFMTTIICFENRGDCFFYPIRWIDLTSLDRSS